MDGPNKESSQEERDLWSDVNNPNAMISYGLMRLDRCAEISLISSELRPYLCADFRASFNARPLATSDAWRSPLSSSLRLCLAMALMYTPSISRNIWAFT